MTSQSKSILNRPVLILRPLGLICSLTIFCLARIHLVCAEICGS